MDRSSTIASREGGSKMIQQPPHVLGAKAYYAVDLKYILKKIKIGRASCRERVSPYV